MDSSESLYLSRGEKIFCRMGLLLPKEQENINKSHMSVQSGNETLRERFLGDCINWMECEKTIVSSSEKCGSTQDLIATNSNLNMIDVVFDISPSLINVSQGEENKGLENDVDVENYSEGSALSVGSVNNLKNDLKTSKVKQQLSARCIPFKSNKSTLASDAVFEKKSLSKRKNCCPYCGKIITNFMRHMIVKHSDKQKVQHYLSICDENLKERKRKRQIAANELRAEGNYNHNLNVVNGFSKTEMLPVKRPKTNSYEVSNITHVSCKHCLGFFKKECFYLHLRSCCKSTNNSNDNSRTCIRESSEILLPSKIIVDEKLKKFVFPTMFKDEISVIAQSDPLILKFGSRFYMSHAENHQRNYISCKMRDLAKLLINIKKLNSSISSFADCFMACNFDYLMDAIRIMCGFNGETAICATPSITARLRSSLVACADILRLEAIKHETLTETEKKEVQQNVDDFMYLLNHEWAVQISANAEKSRRLSRVSKVDILPDSNDIKVFCSYLDEQCDIFIERLQDHPSCENYETLTKVVIGYLIIMNRRRPGEVVNAKLKYYNTLNDNENFGKLEETILSQEDIAVCKNLSIFYIPANKNRKKVPLVLTQKLKNAIDVLIMARENLNIKSELLFPRPDTNSGYHGTEIITELKKKVQLKKPDHFTATGLRHHAATSTQLHKKDENYTRSLAKFLGHTVETHKGYYEMPLPLIQKVLIGKELVEMTKMSNSEVSHISPIAEENCENENTSCKSIIDSNNTNSSNEIDNYNEESESGCSSSITHTPVKKSRKVRWRSEEKEVVYKRFGKYFVREQAPRRKEIKAVWEEEPVLKKNRTLQQVCTYVNNIVTRKIKILTPDKNRIKQRYM